MRNALTALAVATLFLGAAFAQNPDRTFYLTQPATPQDLASMATLIRTVVGPQALSVDEPRGALVGNGTVDQMALTEWLFHQLDQPPGQSAASATPEYRMAGESGDVVRVFRMDRSATSADLTSVVTAIRTIADAQRIFPNDSRRAIVARSSLDRVDTAEWLFHQLSPPAGQTPSADSPVYRPAVAFKGEEDPVVRVFRLDPGTSNQALTALVTAVRTTVDVQRVFPLGTPKAVAIRGSAVRVAAAEWLIHELGQPAGAIQPAAKHEYRMADSIDGGKDGVVRVFYLANRGSTADLGALGTEIRTGAIAIQRIWAIPDHQALILRGRADQMSAAEALIAKFDATGR